MSPSEKDSEKDQTVAVPAFLLLEVINHATVVDYHGGRELCLYCEWERLLVSDEEGDRLFDSPQEVVDAWWAEICATNHHDETCVVTVLRTLLGLPNPRAVYQEK